MHTLNVHFLWYTSVSLNALRSAVAADTFLRQNFIDKTLPSSGYRRVFTEFIIDTIYVKPKPQD